MDSKKIKTFNKRLIILLVIVLAIISTLLINRVSAVNRPSYETGPNGMESNLQTPRGQEEWFGYSDLSYYYDLFCCQKGTELPSDWEVMLEGSHSGGSFSINGGRLTPDDVGMTVENHRIYSQTIDFDKTTYTHKTYGFYELTESHVANPKEAYILAEMVESGQTEYTEEQYAWWDTFLGSYNGAITPPAIPADKVGLNIESDAFQAYMARITGANLAGSVRGNIPGINYIDQSYEFVDNSGNVKTGTITAPEINYQPEWNEDADQNGVINPQDKVTVAWDGYNQEYVVGPFSVNYIKEIVQVSGRNKVDFSSIIGATLVTDAGDLELDKDWHFIWLANQQRDLNEGYRFPNPNEVFYVGIKYRTHMNRFINLKFDFRYMNAGASVDVYEGEYAICNWNVKWDDEYKYYSSHENCSGHFDYRDIWLSLDSYTPYESQVLAHGIKGVRWYEYATLDWANDNSEWGRIRIEKETVNDYGERVALNKTFYFDIYVDGDYFQTVTVKTHNGKGSSTSKPIYWEGGAAPSYEVVEVNYDEDKYVEDGPWYGTLRSNATVTVDAENTVLDKEGYLEIDKKLVNSTPALEGETFTFRVTMTGNFTFEGRRYNATSSNPFTFDVTINSANNWKWKSSAFEWDKSAPHYSVKEVIPDGAKYELVGEINQGDGYLIDDETKVVTATNSSILDGGYIEIDKTLISSTPALEGETFTVRVTMIGEFNFGGRSYNATESNPYIFDVTLNSSNNWHWRSEYIEWKGKEAPKYTVQEINIPAISEFVSVSNGKTTSTENSLTGKLESGGNFIEFTNKGDNKEKEGRIKIVKKVQNDDLLGQTFYFNVKIQGTFTYQGVNYTNETLDLEASAVAGGADWTSEVITWTDAAPTYTITEDESRFPEGALFVSISNSTQTNTRNSITGTVMEGTTPTTITVINNKTIKKVLQGRIQLKKVYVDSLGSEINNKTFKFRVTVGDESFVVEVESGSTWRSGWFYWLEGEEAPTYKIEEIDVPEGCTVSIDKPTGKLEAQNTESGVQGIINVTATNTIITGNHSRIAINKEIVVDDKLAEEDITGTFTFDVTVSGTFKYNDVVYTDTTMTIGVQVSEKTNWSWESKDIYWYGEAPSYAVEETNIPANWKLVSMSNNASGYLENGVTTTVTAKNEWTYIEKLVLTMELGGKVWDDTNKTLDKYADSQENGIIDEGEPGIENVLVRIYRVVRDNNGNIIARLNDVYAYDEQDLITQIEPITYTDANGNWSFGAISVPAYVDDAEKDRYGGAEISYDVEFSYDGQTYEPTTFLATSNGSASTYRNASTAERDNYLYDSMAIDDPAERDAFNASFENITGNEAMDGNGNTLGLATGNGGSKELHYSSSDSVSLLNADNTRKISKLETRDENGYIYDDLLMQARTSTGGLTYPFDRLMHLTNWDKQITDVFTITYYYSATYNYMLSINLGLVQREAVDLGVEKDLTTATVVINGKVLKYRYNSAIDLEDPNNEELLYKQIAVADEQIEYKLGLYSSDYYYRASVYNGSEAGNAIDDFYTRVLNLPKETTELEVYLTYTVIVRNQSETYDVRVNEMADYFDSSFELISESSPREKTHRYVQTVNGKSVEDVIQIADPSTVTYFDAQNQENGTYSVSWTEKENIIGSDQVEYTKMTTNSLAQRNLARGEKAEIKVTFRIEKDSFNEAGVYNTIKLGEKHNVAEVASFSSYYSEASKNKWSHAGQITGRVDGDSAPNNINLPDYNEKTYYEDDTDSAPMITIGIVDEERAISGIVWDDAQTEKIEYSETIGNGIYNPDEGDKVIPDLTTEIIEAISIPTDSKDSEGKTVFKEYEFEWPTDTPIPELGGKTIKELTGFEQSIVTNSNGEYSFIAIPAGNYRVRFVYGDKPIETGRSGYEEVYSGQDYKSTAYQIGFDNDVDDDGYIDNEWHDLTNKSLEATRVSDGRDVEARRLFITAKSQMLTYDNTSILDTADDKGADHTALFGNYADSENKVTGDGYYMYSETAKINLAIENVYNINYTTENIGGVEVGLIDGDITVGATDAGTKDFSYVVKNLDCGIEERSQTKLDLDKQIKEIILTTSDNRVILDAVYNINYEIVDGKVVSNVEINPDASVGVEHVASLNRTPNSQGYRYIMAEGVILQGTTMTVKYQLTVFNVGETDRASKLLETLWEEVNKAETEEAVNDILDRALSYVSTPLYTENKGRVVDSGSDFVRAPYGTYLGSIYYSGKQGVGTRQDEIIVETKVHQMIDYVDSDVDFKDTDNIIRDQSWSSYTIEYLLENKLIDPAIVQIVNRDGEVTGETRANREKTDEERYAILNKEYREYITETKDNIIMNIENGEEGDQATNPALVRDLIPFSAHNSYDESVATINLQVSRYYSSETDASDIDNIAEIIKAENTVGRRDVRAVAGNANPFAMDGEGEPIGEYAEAAKEPDTNATEMITLSPPTGVSAKTSRTIQMTVVILVSAIILAAGIIIIRKKVLTK